MVCQFSVNWFKPITLRIDIFLLILLFPYLWCISPTPPRVLVISFDGFRYNYPNSTITPTLEEIRLEGTQAKYLYNVFVTQTFPNHHSIATGLFPDSHGVIANSFYDPLYNRVLKYSAEMWQYSNETLPIWIHNEENGRERHSGVYMWPGSNFMYRNKLPTFVQPLNTSIPWRERVDTVVNWFLDPDTPANFVMMYFEEPDCQSHKFPPDSEEIKEQIRKVDNTVRYLHRTLSQKNLTSSMNVIFLSDHGVAAVPPENLINVTYIIKEYGEHCLFVGTSPVLHIIPQRNIEDKVYDGLNKLSENNSFVVYRKNELPEKWLYRFNRRIPPIMIVANEGYAFDDIRRSGTKMYGVHGYDNKLKSMHPFFLAFGPRIKKNYTIHPFNTVDLFSLFCDILDLKMEQTNGTFDHVKEMLISTTETSFSVSKMSTLAVSMTCLFSPLMVCLAAVLIKNFYSRYHLRYLLFFNSPKTSGIVVELKSNFVFFRHVSRMYDTNNGFDVSVGFENIRLLDTIKIE